MNKSTTLTKEEWEVVKSHPMNGKKMLEGTCFEEIGDWVMYHHERIDGLGYHGLVGNDIPLESRIIAIADTFSAFATDRAYRERLDFETIAEIMGDNAGSQLDPELTGIFLSIPKDEVESALTVLHLRPAPQSLRVSLTQPRSV